MSEHRSVQLFRRPKTRPRALLVTVLTAGLLLTPGVLVPTASAAALICRDRPYRDLNGDTFEDAVVGDPYATVGGLAEAGTVTVLFGDADGRIGEGERRTLTQADLGETPEAGDHFGWALGLNRTDSGGCYGIIIGSPGEDIGAAADAGMGHVLTFAPVFEGDPGADWKVNLDQSDMGGTVEAGDELGFAVAALGGSDEYPVDFAFGAPGENNDGGVVNRTDSSSFGLSGIQDRQGLRGLPGKLAAGDRFGETLGYFQFLPTEEDDDFVLYVGAPGDVVNGRAGAGSVTTVSKYEASRLFTQNSAGVPGTAETGDRFGASLTQSDLPPGPDPRTMVVGSPGEDIGTVKDAGSVTVFRRSGSTNLPTIALSQDTPGVAGKIEAGDQFGAAVAYRDDRTLAIGIPGEDIGTVVDAGSVQIIRVGKSNLSFPSPSITEDSPGTPGSVAANSRFGYAVAGLASTDSIPRNPPPSFGEAVFAISSLQTGGSVYVISDDDDVDPRFWKPGSGGIGGTGVRFGQSVA